MKILHSNVLYPSLGMDHCSLPLSLSRFYHDSAFCVRYLPDIYFPVWFLDSPEFWDHYSVMYLVNCSTPVKSSLYVEASRCTNTSSHPSSSYFYFLDRKTRASDFIQSCTVIAEVPIMVNNITGLSTWQIYEKLLMGLEFSWLRRDFINYCSYKLSFNQM